MKKEERIYKGEKIVFNKQCCENWTDTCKRMKLEHSLTSYIKKRVRKKLEKKRKKNKIKTFSKTKKKKKKKKKPQNGLKS